MFLFFYLNDIKLVKLLRQKKKLTRKPTQSKQSDANVTIRSKICKVCKTCQTPIHKKYLGLRLPEICDIKNSKTEAHWECQTCMSDKFPFTLVENKVIVQNTFKSSFSCKCQTSCKYEMGRFVFKYRINDGDHERSYGNIIDNNDAILDEFVLQPNFKYYDNHEFHKLRKQLHQTNDFSLFYINICSLNVNLENFETLISNLEFSFSVIAVSETWTPKGKIEVKPSKLEGYQNYHENKRSSIKSGCSFYVKEGIKFKPRKDLDTVYHDTDNKFQSTWIEILNDNKPNKINGVNYRHLKKKLK